MLPGGRERRRQDAVGRLRRALYGLMLAGAACSVAAEDSGARHPLQPAQLLAQLGNQLSQALHRPGGLLHPAAAALHFPQDAETSTAREHLPGLGQAMAPETSSGLGVSLWLPDTGYLYVNLYCPESAQEGDRNWRLSGQAGAGPRRLTVSLRDERDLLRYLEDQDTAWLLAPQLVIDLKTVLHLKQHAEVRLHYSRWYGRDVRYDGPDTMPQMLLSWSF